VLRCGSVITDLELKFNSTIREREVIDILRNAAKNGMLGVFEVNVSSIKGIRPVGETTTTAARTTSSNPPDSTFLCVSAEFFMVIKLLLSVLQYMVCIPSRVEPNMGVLTHCRLTHSHTYFRSQVSVIAMFVV